MEWSDFDLIWNRLKSLKVKISLWNAYAPLRSALKSQPVQRTGDLTTVIFLELKGSDICTRLQEVMLSSRWLYETSHTSMMDRICVALIRPKDLMKLQNACMSWREVNRNTNRLIYSCFFFFCRYNMSGGPPWQKVIMATSRQWLGFLAPFLLSKRRTKTDHDLHVRIARASVELLWLVGILLKC